MRRLKICILGNSVSLRNRPVEAYPNNKNYGALLEESLSDDYQVTVVNKAFGRATVIDISERMDSYINEFPDFYILNIGVCDATTRPVSRFYGDIINNPKSSFLKTVLSSVYYRIIKPHSSFFVKFRGYKSWVSKKKFRIRFENIVSELTKDTNAEMIILSINKGIDRVENIVPRSRENYLAYNSIIKDISNKYGHIYLDTTDMDDKEYYPDGTHYNLSGNKEIASRLTKIIKESV